VLKHYCNIEKQPLKQGEKKRRGRRRKEKLIQHAPICFFNI
jgi:hypothetical protein